MRTREVIEKITSLDKELIFKKALEFFPKEGWQLKKRTENKLTFWPKSVIIKQFIGGPLFFVLPVLIGIVVSCSLYSTSPFSEIFENSLLFSFSKMLRPLLPILLLLLILALYCYFSFLSWLIKPWPKQGYKKGYIERFKNVLIWRFAWTPSYLVINLTVIPSEGGSHKITIDVPVSSGTDFKLFAEKFLETISN